MIRISKRWGAALTATLALSGAAHAEEFGRLPADWFVLPEDGASFYASDDAKDDKVTRDGNTYARSEEAVASTLDNLFSYSATSLQDSGATIGSRDKPPGAPDDWVPWHLKEIYMDLGVNAAGTAGLVTGIGEATVEIRWAQTKAGRKAIGLAPAKALDEDGGEERQGDLALDDRSTRLEIEQQVDQIAEAVMATGRVTDRTQMREGLMQVASDLQSIMVNINAYNDSYWDVNKFGLDVEISASGKVSTGFTVGGQVRLRFEWTRKTYDRLLPEPRDGGEDKREDLRTLLAGIAKDMDTVDGSIYRDSGFDLKTVRLGIGLYLSAKFGVVKGKLGVTGYAFFTKKATRANAHYASQPHIVETEVPLIDDAPKAEHKAYATAHGVRYQDVPGGDGAGRAVFYMTREKFQKGLTRATQMGAWFAKRAKERTGQDEEQRWAIDQVKPQFALSLEGAAKIVTIGGKVSLEFTFKRQ